jgi:hypothetical protein
LASSSTEQGFFNIPFIPLFLISSITFGSDAQFFHQLVGFKKRKFDSVYVYYQLCPKCEEPIIGYKEIKSGEFPALVDHESVLLMTRQK